MSGGPVRGFLDDIVAHIDDDTPRLVYADWLAENGQDDRAEFIRVQVERARLPAWDGAQVRLRLREQELLARHGEAWLAELPAIEGAKWEGFRRGTRRPWCHTRLPCISWRLAVPCGYAVAGEDLAGGAGGRYDLCRGRHGRWRAARAGGGVQPDRDHRWGG